MNHKKNIKNLIKQQNKVFVEWDGGTDMLILKMHINGNSFSYPYLENIIIDKLSIPSAGPPQNVGQGEVFIDNNSVILRFSSRIHEEGEDFWVSNQGNLLAWNEDGETVEVEETYFLEPVQLEDSFNIKNHLHRIEILLMGEFDSQFNSYSWIHTNIIQGDKIELTNKVESFYKKK